MTDQSSKPPAPHALPELAEARDPAAPHILFHDFETRSRADLKAVGAAKYAADPSTEVLLLSYAVDDEPVQLWVPGDPVPSEFIEAALNPAWITVAHNDAFDRAISRHVAEPRHGFPAIPIERRRCSMAMAQACALPAALDKAAAALGLPYRKDRAGQALMLRMAKPLPGGGWLEDAASLEGFGVYARRDTEVMRALFKALRPLIASEQEQWQLDARVNERGFAVDGTLLEPAQRIVTEAGATAQAEFRALTGLNSTNQTAKLVAWLGAQGCTVKDITKGTLKAALRRKDLDPAARRAIELRLQLAHASAAKVEALLAWRGADDRVRGCLQYHGAATGRWTGRGPQPQNFKRDGDGIDSKIAAIMAGGAGLDSPVEAVGDIARAMIRAAPGHRLLIGDFSGIESRVLAWASGQQSKLDRWAQFDRTGDPNDDPYVVIGRSFRHSEETARRAGKIGDLAFGYQGGVGAWRNFAPEDDTSDEATIKSYRDTWRAAHPHTVQFWYAVDRAAISAVRNPGAEYYQVRSLRFRFEPPFLRITLPSGRSLAYPFPRIETNRFDRFCVIFKDNAGGKWTDCNFGNGFYGGAWTENIVSGTARDLLAAAMQRLEAAGYPVVLHVHDEIVCEVTDGFGSLEEFQRIITTVPDWAAGLPIAAKVRESQRFSKPDDAKGADDLEPRDPDYGGSLDPDESGQLEPGAGPDGDDARAEFPGNDAGGAGLTVDDPPSPLPRPWGGPGTTPKPEPADEPKAAGNGAPVVIDLRQRLAALRGGPEPPAGPTDGGAEQPKRYVGNGRDDAAGASIGTKGGNGHDRDAGKICCPFHDDSTPSLQIYADGHFYCFGCHRTGSVDELPDVETLPPGIEPVDRERSLARAHELWAEARPLEGTLGERYLRETRRLDASAFANLGDVLRFHPSCPFGPQMRHPCLLALFRDVLSDEPAGIHRIALSADAQKIERRMLGSWKSWHRAIKFRPAAPALTIGEGIESTLAAPSIANGATWAMGSAGAIGALPLVPGVSTLTILADNDANGVGLAAARSCATRWANAQRAVRLLIPRRKDFNDLRKGAS